jgi:hypothetical protein
MAAISAFHSLDASAPAGAPPSATAANFCTIWNTVKPLVMFVAALPFFARWTAWVQALATAADAICAAPPAPPVP